MTPYMTHNFLEYIATCFQERKAYNLPIPISSITMLFFLFFTLFKKIQKIKTIHFAEILQKIEKYFGFTVGSRLAGLRGGGGGWLIGSHDGAASLGSARLSLLMEAIFLSGLDSIIIFLTLFFSCLVCSCSFRHLISLRVDEHHMDILP